MNPTLTSAEVDALLEVLHRGIVLTRAAAMAKDAARAEAISDAIHNIPRLLSEGHRWGWSVPPVRELFLEPVAERYPDLAVLTRPLDAFRT